MTDRELLHEYLEYTSDTSFVELVRRHIDLVYGAALRDCRDRAMAAASTQDTFSLLARQAGSIEADGSVAVWLFDRARVIARNALDREMRDMPSTKPNPSLPGGWAALEPLLNDAVDTLPEVDREAVVLRCFQARAIPEIGEEIGISEDLTRLHVAQGLASMCAWLARRNLAFTEAELEHVLKDRAATASGLSVPAVAETALGTKADPNAKREPLQEPKPRRSPLPLIAAVATILIVLAIGVWFVDVQPATPMPKLVPPPLGPAMSAAPNAQTSTPAVLDEPVAPSSTASSDQSPASTPPVLQPSPPPVSTASEKTAIPPNVAISSVPAPQSTAPPPSMPAEPSSPPNVRLLGVSMGPQPYAAMQVDGQERIIRQGDSIEDGQVTAIAGDHVTVTMPDGRSINVPLGPSGNG